MKNISAIDPNFRVNTKLDIKDIKFYDISQFPFKIHGVFYESGKFRRIPENIAKSVNDGVWGLHANTAGGRVRFKTDSPYIAIHAKMPNVGKMPHFALTGSAGFDLYSGAENPHYVASFIPPFDINDGFEGVIRFETEKMRDITINLPLYSEVSELYVGVKADAAIGDAEPYKLTKPIVYYGSSITQGGCASRPGNSYESIVSRGLNSDYINLGFSGSARGESTIAEYISKLDMSAFVYDYDYNAPTAEHLSLTHEKMFKTIRETNPDLPILLLSRPTFTLNKDEEKRLDIIKATYNNAIESGDQNVYMIDGRKLMAIAKNDGTVDGCHPNDLGFMSMAKAVGDMLEKIL